ncbi:MAG: YcbK family protein, partial [Pseudomonadota bacterium]
MSANVLRSLLGGCRDVSRRVAAICVALFVLPLPATGAVASERVISLYNIHTKDNITVVFKRGGRYDQAALKRLNWFLRDWRQGTQTKIDPKLFDLLSDIHTELGSQRPIHVISGFRSPKTNALLRKTRGGQARKSRHMRGQAIDVHFPDVPVRQLRYSALVRQAGGVGYYPTSSLPFVHVDTGRVRHWPRMSRTELALLFPSGRTRHVPSDRKPLTRADYRNAKSKRPKLAIQVAQFRAMRSATGARRQTLLASLRPRGQGQALR